MTYIAKYTEDRPNWMINMIEEYKSNYNLNDGTSVTHAILSDQDIDYRVRLWLNEQEAPGNWIWECTCEFKSEDHYIETLLRWS